MASGATDQDGFWGDGVRRIAMLHRVLSHAASHLDRAAHRAMALGNLPAEPRDHRETLLRLERIRALYDRPEHFATPSPFFREPEPIAPRVAYVRSLRGSAGIDLLARRTAPLRATDRGGPGVVVDAFWSSAFSPRSGDFAESYLAHAPNRTAAARLFLHDERPRPAILLLHGYLFGHWALEERVWPVSWLYERGLDVALPVLPFHAVRSAQRGRPLFPSRTEPLVNIEGFSQAVFDVRALIDHLFDRGAPAVGVVGMSLGGYTTGLLATLDPRVAFAVPIIPLVSIADFTRASGDLFGTEEEQRLQHAALDAAYRVVSPLARPGVIGRERILVIGADSDRITPVAHARMLAEHLGAPLEVFRGGHIFQFGRAEAFRAVGRFLGKLGLLSRRPRA